MEQSESVDAEVSKQKGTSSQPRALAITRLASTSQALYRRMFPIYFEEGAPAWSVGPVLGGGMHVGHLNRSSNPANAGLGSEAD